MERLHREGTLCRKYSCTSSGVSRSLTYASPIIGDRASSNQPRHDQEHTYQVGSCQRGFHGHQGLVNRAYGLYHHRAERARFYIPSHHCEIKCVLFIKVLQILCWANPLLVGFNSYQSLLLSMPSSIIGAVYGLVGWVALSSYQISSILTITSAVISAQKRKVPDLTLSWSACWYVPSLIYPHPRASHIDLHQPCVVGAAILWKVPRTNAAASLAGL